MITLIHRITGQVVELADEAVDGFKAMITDVEEWLDPTAPAEPTMDQAPVFAAPVADTEPTVAAESAVADPTSPEPDHG